MIKANSGFFSTKMQRIVKGSMSNMQTKILIAICKGLFRLNLLDDSGIIEEESTKIRRERNTKI